MTTTHRPTRDDIDELEEASRHAASVGAVAMRKARNDVLRIAQKLRKLKADADKVSASILASPAQRGFRDIHEGLTKLVTRAVPEMEAAAEARAQTVGRFRIAAFGRTHAGKSTLNEAMMRGSGATVSDGRTGFTRNAVVYRSGHLDIVDLPGIEAFGKAGEEDERVAEQEVMSADLVLLCFDDQNQKIGEFEKVASWVIRYRKPAIVVLNVKNEGWRDTVRLPLPKHRVNPQRAVSQHADFIRRRLSAVGLDDAPVIALSAQKALFARGSDPWRHPPTFEARRVLRERHGVDKLLDMSNFLRFAAFTRALVEAGGPRLRLAALDGEVAGHARAARDTLRDAVDDARKLADEVLLPQVEAVSRLVGRSSMPEQRLSNWSTLMGARSLGTASGEILALTEDLLNQHVGALEREALAKARRIIEQEVQLDGPAFRAAVFPDEKVICAGDAVGQGIAGFVAGRLDAVKAELGSDLRALLSAGAGTSGRGGRWEHVLGVGVGIGVVAASIALLFPVVAPFVIAVSVASIVASFIGSALRKRAAKMRASARAANLANAEKWIRNSCDELRKHLRKHARQVANKIAHDTAIPLMNAWVGLHRLASLCDAAATPIGAIAARRGAPVDVARFVGEARKRIFQGASVPAGWDPAAWTLLGGDWLQMPGPLDAPEDVQPDPQLARLPPLTGGGDGDRVVDELLGGLDPLDREAMALEVAAARALAASPRRRVVIVGDYSSAKSSLVKRLLVAEGLPVPDDLDVKADPSTAVTAAYEVGDGVELVDTPGLSSGEGGHDERATVEAASAPIGLFCVNPHLLGSQADVARRVLAGDLDAGTAPPEGRWLFVVSRADSLGASPVDDPAAFARVVCTKRAEVSKRLKTWGTDAVPVHFVAADPFLRVGDRRDVEPVDYAGTEGWDGIAALRAEILTRASRLTRFDLACAAGRRVGYAAALRRVALRHDLVRVSAGAELHEQLASYFGQGATRVLGIAKAMPERVHLLLDGAASGARERVTAAADAPALRAAIEAERGWPRTVESHIAVLNDDVGREVAAIMEWVNQRAEQRLDSPLAKLAAERLRADDGSVPAPADLSAWRHVKHAASGAGKLTSEVAVRLGVDPKLLREEIKLVVGGLKKWRPWEATKLAKKLNAWAPRLANASRALGIAAVLLEGFLLLAEEVQRRRFEKARAAALAAINTLAVELAADVVGKGEDGFVPALERLATIIQAEADRLDGRAAASSEHARSLKTRIAHLDNTIQRAVAPSRSEVTP